MTRLSYDIARCKGVSHQEEGVTGWREGCSDCLRRTAPGHPERQVYIEPPPIIAFECENRIAPEEA